MPHRSLLVSAFMLLSCACLTFGQGGELKRYANAEGKFEILLPDVPKVRKTGELTTVSWEKDGQGLSVSFGPLPVMADKNPANRDKMLAAMADESATTMKADVKTRRKLAIFGNPGLEWSGTLKETGSNGVVRTYLVGQRFYQIIAIGKAGYLNADSTKKSLESFKLTK
ncbi:MAG: hypothetical protein U0744_18645 [Gemmataceae bacterium]